MLARNDEAAPAAAKPIEKHRIVTLTNRAPIRINEDEWPVIAQGGDGEGCFEAPWQWSISIRVRRKQQTKRNFFHDYENSHIIHATYSVRDDTREPDDPCNQTVRVGRVLTEKQSGTDLWKHIFEVGEELRERILIERFRKRVTLAVDDCFAHLSPGEI